MADNTSPPRKRGRPTKFTPETRQAIVEYVRAGMSYVVACELARVHFTTFYDWMSRGRLGQGREYTEFYLDIKQARAEIRSEAERRLLEDDPYKWLRFVVAQDRALFRLTPDEVRELRKQRRDERQP